MYFHEVLKSWCPEGSIRVTWQLAANVALGKVYCSPLAFAMQVLGLSKAVPGQYVQVAGVLAEVGRTLAVQITWQQGTTGRAQGP